MARNGIDIRMNLPTDAELSKMFDAVPILERHRVSDRVVRAGGNVIAKRARQLAPQSAKTGSTKKWSKKMFIDGGTGGTARKKGEKPLWKTIKLIVRKGRNAGAISVVGPEWPEGNKAYFNTSPKGRKQVLWGKRTGKVVAQIRNWIVQAFDETKTQQLAAMKKTLMRAMDGVWKSRG